MNQTTNGENQFAIEVLGDPGRYYLTDKEKWTPMAVGSLSLTDVSLYHIQEITFEEKEPRKEALENVLGSMRVDGVNFLYVILGDRQRVNFYFGVARDLGSSKQPPMSVYDIGRFVLLPSLQGNFRGSTIRHVAQNEEKKKLVERIRDMKCASCLEGVPGVNEEDDDEKFQGVDRLVDVMLGDEFAVVVVAKPLGFSEIQSIESNLHNAYSGIVPFMKRSVQDGTTESKGTTTSRTDNTSESHGTNTSTSRQDGKSTSTQTGKNEGTTITDGTQESNGSSNGDSYSSRNRSNSTTHSGAKSRGTSSSESKTENTSTSKTEGSSTNQTKGISTSEGMNTGTSRSSSQTVEFIKKEVQGWVQYLDDTIFKRLDYGKGRGMFITSTLLMTNKEGSLIKLENTMQSLYSGQKGNKVPLRHFSLRNGENRLTSLKNFQIPICKLKANMAENEIYARATLSQCVRNPYVYMGNWISAKELSLLAGLPKKEVIGLGLREEVEFGVNALQIDEPEHELTLGTIVQGGMVHKIPVGIDKRNLDKHTFVTGVTGSGKTTTCQRILIDSELPFLVIEPAKTEYRILNQRYDDLLVFTLGKDTVAPFRMNPFELFPHESITSRVDMIKASLEAAFDMEAAIPQILETAIYACYEKYGWNIATNTNSSFEDPFAPGVYAFPTLSDLIKEVDKVVKDQGFDERLKNDYIGSIHARLKGLMVGAKGLMLNTPRSIDFRQLIRKRVVLELEEVRSASEKALIIGFILTNLVEAIRAEHLRDMEFRHITLVEEAHRLLSKYMPGDSPTKKQSVETFTDMLAEVRKYGECLIIADQIPSKLAPDVLKNTNTKIVHKILAQDDKEAIGDTMALEDEQKRFLSNLAVGRAILFTQGFTKAVQIQVDKLTDTTGQKEVSEAVIRKSALQFYCEHYKEGVIIGSDYEPKQPSVERMERIIQAYNDSRAVEHFCRAFNLRNFANGRKELKVELRLYSKRYGHDLLMRNIHVRLKDRRGDAEFFKDLEKFVAMLEDDGITAKQLNETVWKLNNGLHL